jgi:UPF0271 protein
VAQHIIYIFDTGAFIKGMDVNSLQDFRCYTTDGVLSEIKNDFIKQRVNLAIQARNLHIAAPDLESVQKIKDIAGKTGDLPFLSTTDVDVLALALDLMQTSESVLLITDDYSIQNVASKISIHTSSFLQKGINDFIQWQIYCPVCKNIYTEPLSPLCTSCGATLKRRPIEEK